ncbi:phosphatase PAP2 family protein [Phormidium sp. LEGE 05292]|uniref:vanadium-dependent haloperoxidase n=1 Tax=[Phormidium] sp. LEGE 05292 TaxID=767427 RepID=UPI0018828A86|nr:vanadium-dependent haloperoxidase [Phormidium sp. LEGE 05292]MBE9227646.1 phosphatase PAP2 family protein [Phormidium sp. LEGE 05292]
MANPSIFGSLGRNFAYTNDAAGLDAFKKEWLTAAKNQGIEVFSNDFNGTKTNYFDPIAQSNLTLDNNSWQTFGHTNGMGVAAAYAGWYTETSKIRAEINYNPNTGESQKLTYKWTPNKSVTSAFIDLSAFTPLIAEKWGNEVGYLRAFKNGQEVDITGFRMVNETTQSISQASINNSQLGVRFTADDGVGGDFKFRVTGNFDELRFEARPYDSPNGTQPVNQFGFSDSSDFLVQQIKYEGTEDSLQVGFQSINLPQTIDFGADGTARVTVTNQGMTLVNRPVTVNLYISTDETIDRVTPETLVDGQEDLKNDGLLAKVTQNVNLLPGQSTTFDIPYKNLTSVVSPGGYHLIAEVDPLAQSSTNKTVSQYVSAPGTDVVIDWMSTFLNAVQEDPESGDPVGSAPPEGTRAAALLSAAIYDTVNAFEKTHKPYLVDQTAPIGASKEAAVAGAAHYILSLLYPSEVTQINAQLERSLAEASGTALEKTSGANFGRSIAQAVMISPQATALSVADPDLGYTYTPNVGDYVWQVDLPNKYALGAGYGEDAVPFAVPDSDTFAPTFDGVYKSDLYAKDIEEVRLAGGKANTATTTINRTADQTQLVYFWAYDRPDTFRPYGQLIQIAQETAVREGNTIGENARLFLQLSVALADSAITAWDAKYTYNQPRPNDAIAGWTDPVTGQFVAPLTERDGRADTTSDRNWESLLPTPPFPDFISGHSTFGGAFGTVMTNFFGDNYKFTAVSQELIGTTRTFNSFNQAGFEDAISRLYAGVHVREAIEDAVTTGQAVANYVVNNIAQPV